ncbi:MAG: hypothetical protein M3322_04440 [Actinomycetota bacterium]|nr:hypothetical protein [Actinomycetota bacterium]
MRPSTRSVVAVSALAGILAGMASGATDGGRSREPQRRVIPVAGELQALAMDGGRLAYDIAADPSARTRERRCNRVLVWTLATRRTTKVSGSLTCSADSTSTGAGVRELAVAGERVAWIVNRGGNTESGDQLLASSVRRPRERRLASASRSGNVDCVLSGRWVGGLVGDRDLLAYNVWTTRAANPGQSCAMRITSGAVRRIVGARTAPIAGGTDVVVAKDADRGRIAVLRADGGVELLSQRGRLLRRFGTTGVREVALGGDLLVVLTRARMLEVYGVRSGALISSHPVPAGAAHLDAAPRLATYSAGGRLHLVQLPNGRDVVVATVSRRILDATIESSGLAYGYGLPWTRRLGSRGRIVFVPMALVLRSLGEA